jgi:hypothetical protein
MSLDLSMYCKCCGNELCSYNITYNLGGMWRAIYPEHESMIPIDYMTGEEAYPIILHALEQMIKRKEEMQNLEPPNGFGNYDDFLSVLNQIMIDCLKYLDITWKCSR